MLIRNVCCAAILKGRGVLAEEVRLEDERREDSEQYGEPLQDADRRHRRPFRPSEARPKSSQGEESAAAPHRPRMARCVNEQQGLHLTAKIQNRS